MKDFPYVVAGKKVNAEAEEWCRQNVGRRRTWHVDTGEWACFWAGGLPDYDTNRYNWYFKNETDAIMFALKWS